MQPNKIINTKLPTNVSKVINDNRYLLTTLSPLVRMELEAHQPALLEYYEKGQIHQNASNILIAAALLERFDLKEYLVTPETPTLREIKDTMLLLGELDAFINEPIMGQITTIAAVLTDQDPNNLLLEFVPKKQYNIGNMQFGYVNDVPTAAIMRAKLKDNFNPMLYPYNTNDADLTHNIKRSVWDLTPTTFNNLNILSEIARTVTTTQTEPTYIAEYTTTAHNYFSTNNREQEHELHKRNWLPQDVYQCDVLTLLNNERTKTGKTERIVYSENAVMRGFPDKTLFTRAKKETLR